MGKLYKGELKSIGDHLRKKRTESGLLQKDVAKILKVSEDCLTFWEGNKAEPQVCHVPLIIKFLGYNPYTLFFNGNKLSDALKLYRFTNGLSHKRFGHKLGVDASTVGAWENGKSKPHPETFIKIKALTGIDFSSIKM